MGYRLTLGEDRQVELFFRRVDDLEETPLMKRRPTLETGLRLTFNIEQGTSKVSRREPDENDLRGALTIIRQFRLDDEPVFVNRICNVCMRTLKAAAADPAVAQRASELSEYLDAEREKYKTKHKHGSLVLKIDGETIGPEEAWDIWINGHYFHADAEKAATLQSLMCPVWM